MQNLVVIEAFSEAARRFVAGGYDVIVDGIIGPWFLSPWLNLAKHGCLVHYFILRASKEETLKRAVERTKLNRETNVELVRLCGINSPIWDAMNPMLLILHLNLLKKRFP